MRNESFFFFFFPRTLYALLHRFCVDSSRNFDAEQMPKWDGVLWKGATDCPKGSYQTGIVDGNYCHINVRLLLFGFHLTLCVVTRDSIC